MAVHQYDQLACGYIGLFAVFRATAAMFAAVGSWLLVLL